MKKVISLQLFLVCCITLAWSQKPKTNQTPPTQPKQEEKKPAELKPAELMVEHFVKKYTVASRWNDQDVAKDALYDLIIEFPGSDSLIFSLAYRYYEGNNHTSAILVCNDLLARNPKHEPALEVSAVSYENLNILDRALQNYESLYLLRGKTETLYKMATLQYHLKKYQESMTNIDILLTKPEATTLTVTYDDKDKKSKEYPLKVALLNLKGMVYKDQADKVNARKFFDEALKAAPDFLPAKQNLEGLK